MLAVLVLARLCLTLFILGSLGLATAATCVSHACPCPLLFNFIFQYFCLSWASWLCTEPGPPVSLLGAVMGFVVIHKGCFPLPVFAC